MASNLGREGLYNGRPLGICSIIRAKIRGIFVGTDLEDFEPKGKNIQRKNKKRMYFTTKTTHISVWKCWGITGEDTLE